MFVTNLRDEQQSVTIPLADGRVIRELIQPGETRTITDIDPFDINTHKISRRLVFQDRHLNICFAAEPDDLLPLTGLLPLKGAARVGTTGNITLSGLQIIDSVQLTAGDRVLVHAQTNAVDNGIWVAQIGAWVRARDADGCAPLEPNSFLWVSEGSTHADTLWRLVTDAPIVVGTTPQDWDEFVGGGATAAETLLFGADRVGASTTTRYLYTGYSDHFAEVNPHTSRVTKTGTLRNMRVVHNDPKGNGGTITYRARINSIATALVVSLASTAASASNLVTTVSVSAGDIVDVQITKTASVGSSPRNVVAIMEVV